MTLLEIIERANNRYGDECVMIEYWLITDPDKLDSKVLRITGSGDTLAAFIASELSETFDPAASDKEQLAEATRCMSVAAEQLLNVAMKAFK